jgi:hypothetical protein
MTRRQFIAATTAGALASGALAGRGKHLTVLSTEGCGRATAYPETNKIITLAGKTHVCWLDSPAEGFVARIATLSHRQREWEGPVDLGEAFDNHGGPALAVDSRGILHTVYYPHHHPFRYRRSLSPNDASAWSEEAEFGERCTYPSMVCGSDDTLYLCCRESSDARWGLHFYRKRPDTDWEGPLRLFEGQAPGGYIHLGASLAIDPRTDRLHIGFHLYETATGERGYLVSYLTSADGGDTWTTSAGERLDLPAGPSTVEPIARAAATTGPEDHRVGNLILDAEGQPWLTYTRWDGPPWRTYIAVLTGPGHWRRLDLLPAVERAWPGHGIVTPGGATFGGDGQLHVVGVLLPNDLGGESHWGHSGAEVIWLASTDRGRSFQCRRLSPGRPGIPDWLPSIERPTGHNVVGVPHVEWTHGHRGDSNAELLRNDVLFARLG